ncbi:MAG: hypothetical protein IPI39_05730 [Candidatus Obscuribacter sp.]|nr:hypothetical protein [Candidatus Obscuribacter sp.]
MSSLNQSKALFLAPVAAIFTAGFASANVKAADSGDWGYEDIPGQKGISTIQKSTAPKQSASAATKGRAEANPAKQLNAPAPASTNARMQPQPLAEPQKPAQPRILQAFPVKNLNDLQSWLEIFALVHSSPQEDDRTMLPELATLSNDQQKELTEFIQSKLTDQGHYKGIAPLWAQVRAKVSSNVDYKFAYRALFRALIRHWLLQTERASQFDGHSAVALPMSIDDDKKPKVSSKPEPIKLDKVEELFAELMGSSRIIEEGPPPLTEDAVLAYTDMTCFLYAKTHPDKTVDQDDNREIFANVVKDKFNNAPTAKAKLAMSNFDLTWASFRCRYLEVNESERLRMIKTIAAPSGNASVDKATLFSEVILQLFAKGPWGESLSLQKQSVKPQTVNKSD